MSSTEEGLIRAAMQDYAFFSGQQAARTTIRFVVNSERILFFIELVYNVLRYDTAGNILVKIWSHS